MPKRNAGGAALPLLALKAAPAPAPTAAADDAAAWHIKSAATVHRLASLNTARQQPHERKDLLLAEDEMDSARSIMALQDATALVPATAAAEEELAWLPLDLQLTAEEVGGWDGHCMHGLLIPQTITRTSINASLVAAACLYRRLAGWCSRPA